MGSLPVGSGRCQRRCGLAGARDRAVDGPLTVVWPGLWSRTGGIVRDVQQLINLERALLSPAVRGSVERLDELLDPEFREIGASGRLWTRGEMISALVEGDQSDEPIEAEDFHATPIGTGLVLLTYVSDPAGRVARRSSLWRRSGDRWRLLHHQGTLLPRP